MNKKLLIVAVFAVFLFIGAVSGADITPKNTPSKNGYLKDSFVDTSTYVINRSTLVPNKVSVVVENPSNYYNLSLKSNAYKKIDKISVNYKIRTSTVTIYSYGVPSYAYANYEYGSFNITPSKDLDAIAKKPNGYSYDIFRGLNRNGLLINNITVYYAKQPDLVISNLKKKSKKSLYYYFTIKNIGDEVSNKTKLGLYVGSKMIKSIVIGKLNPNKSKTFKVKIAEKYINKIKKFYIDYTKTNDEIRTDNNIKTIKWFLNEVTLKWSNS